MLPSQSDSTLPNSQYSLPGNLNIADIIGRRYPAIRERPGGDYLVRLMELLLHQQEINQFIDKNRHLRGFAFLNQILEHFEFSYRVSDRSLKRIPSEGRVIIIANHPIGSLDGLSLLKLVRSVRSDVRIVANELLASVEPLQQLFLPVDNMGKGAGKAAYKAMLQSLQQDEAVIIFPAGEVSRIRPNGVRDGKWKSGFLRLAQKSGAPILPVYIDAKNSLLFYSLSALYKPLGTLWLVNEMFNKKNQEITFFVGKPIAAAIVEPKSDLAKLAKQFRKHLLRLPKKGKKPLLTTFETIEHPVNRQALKKELHQSTLLGETADGKKIYLFDYHFDSTVMQEIARLRELTFRSVEEGTGKALDMDYYDSLYRHIVLWDENDLEIVGAYRLGEGRTLLQHHSLEGFYSHTLFELQPEIVPKLPHAIELGRSFIQPRYWGLRGLDYLWYGIGAYLKAHPDIRYLFGPVSLSQSYPDEARQAILAFYQHQFGGQHELATARTPYTIHPDIKQQAEQLYQANYTTNFKQLNQLLTHYGVKVPTLYKQYSELCEPGGCSFVDFNLDANFGDCVDSLIWVEIEKVLPKKRKRYVG
ncbi:lysophospholipid acyltransferase family protein [Ectothiorhodospiraceae bacterium BW-2]|nr:lysophospholipid acyltransferase family protein [Ectothiorhodospiraceae bacterium BW-2]